MPKIIASLIKLSEPAKQLNIRTKLEKLGKRTAGFNTNLLQMFCFLIIVSGAQDLSVHKLTLTYLGKAK